MGYEIGESLRLISMLPTSAVTTDLVLIGPMQGERKSEFTGAVLGILSKPNGYEIEVALGETFPLGDQEWRLDKVSRSKRADRRYEAYICRVS